MSDPKEIAQLREDLELVTKTAKVLATKLEKITQSIEQIFSTLDTLSSISSTQTSTPPPKATRPSPTPQPTPRPKTQPSATVDFQAGTDTKATRLLDAFLAKLQVLNTGSEISEALSALRDQVMQASSKGFHPAFHEMGRYANQLKNQDNIPPEEKEALIEKVYDWKTRLVD